MNRAKTTMQAADLTDLAVRILFKARFEKDDAKRIADVLVWADLRGHGSHGVSRLKKYLEFIQRGDLDPQAEPTIVRDLGALIQIDGRKAAGQIAVSLGTDAAVAGARRFGAAWALVGHATHAGPIGYYMERIAQSGLIGVAFAAGSPLMAYHGSSKATVSTSPIAIGIPSAGEFPYIIDMATSIVASGKIQQAVRSKSAIPAGWALDKAGRATTDPNLAAYLAPLGGPKGAGLSLAFEMICSLGAGAPILQRALRGPAPHVQNAAICAIDIGQLHDLDSFRQDVGELMTLMKNQPRAEGCEEILMPGERSARTAAKRLKDGVPLQESLVRELMELERGDAPSGESS